MTGAILRPASLRDNRNPTSNTTCAQFYKLLFFGRNLTSFRRSLATWTGRFPWKTAFFMGAGKYFVARGTDDPAKAVSG